MTITGIRGDVEVSVTGEGTPKIKIADGEWGTSGTIVEGATLEVQLTSSNFNETTSTASVTVGTESDDWIVTTVAVEQDDTPEPFTFEDITDAEINTVTTSNPIIITGISGDVTANVSGTGFPQIKVADGEWGTFSAINNGDVIEVRLTSGNSENITEEATVTIGTESTAWKVTTKEALFSCGDVLTDNRDNETYNTVEIGTQCWFAQNLRAGLDSDMSTTNPNTASNDDRIEKHCLYDDVSNCNETNGAWYNWDEAMGYSTAERAQGICPDGWHIPSDGEVKTLEIELGMSQAQADDTGWRGTDQGTKIKTGGSSGFEFNLIGFSVPSWFTGETWLMTSTKNGDNFYYRNIQASQPGINREGNGRITQLSTTVRCLKN